jgi:hypothetical protein
MALPDDGWASLRACNPSSTIVAGVTKEEACEGCVELILVEWCGIESAT